jgi:lambda family phage minor tail protein L
MGTSPLNAPPPIALLSIVANIERHKVASGEPWILLLDLEWPGDASSDPDVTQQHLRLARNIDPITFDANDGLGAQVYQPFNFSMGDFAASTNGSVPELEVQASNVMRVIQGIIEQYAGVVGANVYLYVVNSANPAGEPDLTLQFTVKQTICDAKLVHFKLGSSSPLRRLFPIHMYRPNFCIWQYNSPALQAAGATVNNDMPGSQCGYIGALTTCSHTYDGATGCQAHGNQMRFGGFPGIDTNGINVATVI